MNKTEIDFTGIRADRESLVRVLSDAGAAFKGNVCGCPFHDDKHASAGIYQADDGGWRFKCQAAGCGFGGDVLDVRAKLSGTNRGEEIRRLRGVEFGEPLPSAASPTRPPVVHRTLEALKAAAERSDREAGGKVKVAHVYRGADGKPALIVLRLERPDGSKAFRQCRPEGDGYAMQAPPKPWPLYSLARVQESELVIVVEGEKAAGALQRFGFTATTSAAGAGKARYADWAPLAGKTVYLWPDADPVDPKTGKRTGLEHMRDVAGILDALPTKPAAVYWIDPDRLGLPDKGDAADFVELHGVDAAELVQEVLRQAVPLGPLSELESELADAVAGRRFAVPLPWTILSTSTRALLPGTVTILCGSPGATKSLCTLQALRYWISNGNKAVALELEDGKTYHLRRALAQIAENSDLTRDDWCREHPDEVEAAKAAARAELESLQPCLDVLPQDTKPTPEAFLAWIARAAESGNRIIAIDPVTFMQRGKTPWTADETFLLGAKRIIEAHGASLFLVTHPRKMPAGAKPGAMSIDDLAGGVAYSRFAQTILYLSAHTPKAAHVRTSCGVSTVTHNRTLTVFKARNGRGREWEQNAFQFDGTTLTLHELGVVVED
ncbi:MAG: AAA family ATPase [Planctomycetota bacterium]|nr:AAA family ATPase [Planctomycetota bacterium]